jgi:hypothetical protein
MATPYPRYGVDARKDMGNEYPICALRPVLSLRSFEGFCVSISAGPERYASGFLWPAFCASFFEYPAIRSQTRRPHRNCSQSCVACTHPRLQGNPVQRQSVSACTHLALVPGIRGHLLGSPELRYRLMVLRWPGWSLQAWAGCYDWDATTSIWERRARVLDWWSLASTGDITVAVLAAQKSASPREPLPTSPRARLLF